MDFVQRYRGYAFAAIAVLGVIGSFIVISPLLPGLMWAAVLTVLAQPIYARCRKRFSPNASATFTTFGTILLIGLPLLLVGGLLIAQLASYGQEFSSHRPDPSQAWTMDEIIRDVDVSVKPILERLGATNFSLTKWFAENKDELGKNIGRAGLSALKGGGYAVFTLVVAFLTMFYLLRDGNKLLKPALELIPLPEDRAREVLERMRRTIQAVFVGVVMVAVIQGGLAGLAYWVAGVPSPLVWTVATMVLCAIPLVGAPVIYVPMGLLLLAQGKFVEGGCLLAFGFGVVSQVDNILRPFIIATQIELHPMAIFFSLLGGVVLLGPVGLMAGPVLLTVMLAVQEVLRDKLRGRREEEEEAGAAPA